jgi:hypothetical protein
MDKITSAQHQPRGNNSGQLYLILGIIAVLLGPVIYAAQISNHFLSSPWHLPALATFGAVLVVVSLAQRRTIWRFSAAGLTTLFAALAWLLLLVGLSAPPYTGSAEVGKAFPEFETKLADGTGFSRVNLTGGQNTVLIFFRGRW